MRRDTDGGTDAAGGRTRTEKDGDPFLRVGDGTTIRLFDFRCNLTEAVMDGLTFSQDTIDFWSRQPRETQQRVIGGGEDELFSPRRLYQEFFAWIEDLKQDEEADHVVLWCQGQDFDIPMMKHCAAKYGLKMPFNQYGFRDCRTVAFEMALMDTGRTDEIFRHPKSAPYELLPPIPDALMGYSHDASFDCIRSTWSTWNVMLRMRQSAQLIRTGISIDGSDEAALRIIERMRTWFDGLAPEEKANFAKEFPEFVSYEEKED